MISSQFLILVHCEFEFDTPNIGELEEVLHSAPCIPSDHFL